MRHLRFIALAAFILSSWAGTAHADNVIMEFIESWSGPGPYPWAKGVELQVACLPTREGAADSLARQFWNCHTGDASRVRAEFMFNVNWGDNGGNQLFTDDQFDRRNVKQLTLEAVYMHRVNSVVDIGGGIQGVRLTADAPAATSAAAAYSAATLWRTGVPFRVTFTPLGFMHFEGRARGLSRLVHLQYESTYFGGSSQASDYGNPFSRYSAKREFQSRVGVSLDIAPLLVAIHPN